MKKCEKPFWIAQVRECYLADLSYTETAKELGWTLGRLRTFSIANNIYPNKDTFYKRDKNFQHSELFQEIEKLIIAGEKQNHIAKKLKVTRQYVSCVKYQLIKEGIING